LSSRKINVVEGNTEYRDRQITLFVNPEVSKSKIHQVLTFRFGQRVRIFVKKYEKTLIFEIIKNHCKCLHIRGL